MKKKYRGSSLLAFLGVSMTGILAIKNTIDLMHRYNKVISLEDVKQFKLNDYKKIIKIYTPTLLSMLISTIIIYNIDNKNKKVFNSLKKNLYLSSMLLNNSRSDIITYKHKDNSILDNERYTFFEPLSNSYIELSFGELDTAFNYINTKFNIDGSISIGEIYNILNPTKKSNKNNIIFLKKDQKEYIDYRVLSSYIESDLKVNDLIVYILEINKGGRDV